MTPSSHQSLFDDDDLAARTLDTTGLFGISVSHNLQRFWQVYEPYADGSFRSGLNDAVAKLDRFSTPSDNRARASHAFHQKYWEMSVGVACLERNADVVPYIRRRKDGPDHLLSQDGRKCWIECIAPGPGSGPDRVIDHAADSQVREVQEEGVRLRQTHAIREKILQYQSWVRDGVIDENDRFVIALNDRCVPDSNCDVMPPRIVRSLFGIGTFAVDFNMRDHSTSEPYLTQQSSTLKQNASVVSFRGFLDDSLSSVSSVIYSNENAWNPAGFTHLPNFRARHPLPEGWFIRCTEWMYEESATGARIRCLQR